jgi:ribonuclease HII
MTATSAMILGIDEAGRGPVIGPLVLCGIWARRSRLQKLEGIGARDSKSFGSTERARKRRAQLAAQIRTIADHIILLCVDAAEVDRRTRLGELNLLEQELAAAVISAGPAADRIIADGARLFGPLRAAHPQLRAKDHADANHVLVAAASIVAKDERDAQFARIVAQIEGEFGPIRGGGYANGETAKFLRTYFERHGQLPAEVRRSWSWAVLREINRRQAGAAPVRRAEQLSLLVERDTHES